VRDLSKRFLPRKSLFDPYQMHAVATRLAQAGIAMEEFPQSVPNLTECCQNLFEAIKGRTLTVYPDADIRLAVSRCVAVETARGWRIAKDKQSHRRGDRLGHGGACRPALAERMHLAPLVTKGGTESGSSLRTTRRRNERFPALNATSASP
jgi:hypothetical protein